MAKGEVVYFDHDGSECKDRYHRRCAGRWRERSASAQTGLAGAGGRKLSATSKAELESRMDKARRELARGVNSSPTYTVEQAVTDWLRLGMADKAPKTIATLTTS